MKKNENGYYVIKDDMRDFFDSKGWKEKLNSGGGVVLKSGINTVIYMSRELPKAIERQKK